MDFEHVRCLIDEESSADCPVGTMSLMLRNCDTIQK
jgi:hypothetical protein